MMKGEAGWIVDIRSKSTGPLSGVWALESSNVLCILHFFHESRENECWDRPGKAIKLPQLCQLLFLNL